MMGHALGPCDQGWNAESQSIVFNLPFSGVHKPACKHFGVLSGECSVGGNMEIAWKRGQASAGRSYRSGTMAGFIDRAGRREGPRVVMRNPKDLPVLPHRKSSYSPEHPKTCKLQCVERTKPGQTAPLEPSGATEKGKLFQDVEGRVQQGQSTAQRCPVIHCAGLRSPCPLCTFFSC